MIEEAYLPIREFSRLTGISRETLRFYDKIALLCPENRGKNSYRYYGSRQLDMAFLITELRALGMSLKEIKEYAHERTPEKMLKLFQEQNDHIEEEIKRLRSIQTLMGLRAKAAEDALRHEEGEIFLEERVQEPIFLCPLLKSGITEMDASLEAYDYAAEHGINIGYPFGIILPEENLRAKNRPIPVQFYFKAPKNYNAWKRGGTYAVYHCRREKEPEKGLYPPLLSFIKEKGLRIEGDAYEEYPLDELATQRWEEYWVRVEVRVVSD